MKYLLMFAALLAVGYADHFPPQECVIDVGFVMDGSGSVTSSNWVLMLAFVQRFARHVQFSQSGTRIGVVSYGNTGTVNIGLDEYSDVLLFENAVQVIPYKDENTNTASGIRALRTLVFNTDGDRLQSPNVAVVMTDGASTWEANNTIPEATAVKNSGAKIFAIGIGEKINQEEVNDIASDPDTDFVRTVDEFSDLDSLVEFIVNSTCEIQREIVTTPTPTTSTTASTTTTPEPTTEAPQPTTTTTTTTTTSPPPTTTTTTQPPTTTTQPPTTTTSPPTTTTTTSAPATTTTTTPTTTTTQPTTSTTRAPDAVTTKLDVAFLLDSSGSIGYNNWQLIKQFVKQLVDPWTLGADDTRVSVIAYSTRSFLMIHLDQYNSHSDFNTAVDNIAHLNQRTNTSGAIRMTYMDVLTVASRRQDARQVAVVVTDGDSNTDQQFLQTESAEARRRGINVFTVGVGNTTSMAELKLAASRPYYHFIHMMAEYTDLVTSGYTVADALTKQSYPPQTLYTSYEDCPATVVMVADVPADLSDPLHAYIDGHFDAFLESQNGGQMTFTPYRASTSRGGQQSYKNVQGVDLADVLRNLRADLIRQDNDTEFVFIIIMTGNYGDADTLEDEIEALKDDKVKVMIVPIGDAVDDVVLLDLCSEPKNNNFRVQEDFESLLRNNQNDLDFLRDEAREATDVMARDICKLAAEELWRCSFEETEPARCNMEDDQSADFTWSRYSLQTPSRHTGPDSAHHGRYYMYTEASSPRRDGDTAVLYLPFSGEGDYCLSFYYHMHGWHIGVLDVIVLRQGQEQIVWRMSGQQGQDWLHGNTLLQLHTGDRIGIRGIRAEEFSGDIGLDSLRIQKGSCLGDV